MDEVNILTNYETALRFRALSEFQLDLGKGNLKEAGKGKRTTVFKIADNFIDFVFQRNGFLVFKIGSYGKLTFYYSNVVKNNDMYVFLNDQEHEFQLPNIPNDQLESWISEQLFKIASGANV